MLKKPEIRNILSSLVRTLINNFFQVEGDANGIIPSKTSTKAKAERKLVNTNAISNKKGLRPLNP